LKTKVDLVAVAEKYELVTQEMLRTARCATLPAMNAHFPKVLILWLAAAFLFAAPLIPPALAFDKSADAAKAVTFKNMNVAEAEKLLAGNKEIVVLDVRTPRELRGGRLAGARHINFYDSDFDQQVAKLDREKTYVVYCAVGGRSAKACEKMAQLGFKSLVNLDGGIKAWEKEGKKVVR
jgi:phage shock protein E